MINKYCTECSWSVSDEDQSYSLRCRNPSVNAKDSWALASKKIKGTDCYGERSATFWAFPACGIKGKMWEPKKVTWVAQDGVRGYE